MLTLIKKSKMTLPLGSEGMFNVFFNKLYKYYKVYNWYGIRPLRGSYRILMFDL